MHYTIIITIYNKTEHKLTRTRCVTGKENINIVQAQEKSTIYRPSLRKSPDDRENM